MTALFWQSIAVSVQMEEKAAVITAIPSAVLMTSRMSLSKKPESGSPEAREAMRQDRHISNPAAVHVISPER